MTFVFLAESRCFVGTQTAGAPCIWQEWNSVAYDSFLATVAKLKESGVACRGDEASLVITQQYPLLYHTKGFRTRRDLDEYIRANPWDSNFIAVARPEILRQGIEYKQAA